MDIVRNIQVDFAIMKEPRGFLRIIQFVLSILAFATICTSATAFVKVTCAEKELAQDVPIKYSYPFNLKDNVVDGPFCEKIRTPQMPFTKVSFAGSAQFFCFIGVMSFLLCIAYCVGYIIFSPVFAKESRGATIDFVFSAVWTLMWFIASVAWADRLTVMGTYLSPKDIIAEVFNNADLCLGTAVTCTPGESGDHATLVVSVLFGFLNMLVWGAGLWFLFKETSWHKEVMPNSDVERFDQPQADPGAGGYQQPDAPTEPTPASTGY